MADSARGKDSQSSNSITTVCLETEIALLRRQLLQATVENSRKDAVIESLEDKLKATEDGEQSKSDNKNQNESLAASLKTENQPPSDMDGTENKKVRDIVDEIQRWLFVEGGNLRDVESLLTKYCKMCRSLKIPLDQLCAAGMMMHPHTTACVWKWELGCEFSQNMVPPEAFEPPAYNPDEPFAVLMEGRAMEYKMNADTEEAPPGCAWFQEGGFQDYFALPLYHNGKFKGAMSWSTKSQQRFSEEHCEIFKRSLTALSTVLRLYANDLVIDKAMMRLEESVQSQTQKLETANANLEQANRLIIDQSQKQLKHFAMMSHEIRTPLNCIVGISNLMLDSCDDEGMRESIEMITGSGDLLLAVVDDVLDYSKLAAGKVETRIEPTKLSLAVKTVETSIRIKAKSNELEFRTSMSPDLPEYIVTDGRRLQQILYNLLGNAIKFGSEGKFVDFTISVQRDAQGDFVKFAIKDYGNGIAPNEMQNIFEPFRQLASNEPSHGGTGLGLAITRQLVKALGGTVSVQSDYGHWCEFTFCLPCTSRNLEGNAAANVADIRRGSVESAYSDYSFSDSETCASMDTSNASYGGLSTTSFQKVVDAAARKQVANMAGTQILAPQLTSPNGSLEKGRVQLASPFSLAKSGSQTSFGVCSFGSQASFGLGCLSESQPCMNNKDFVFTRHMSAGSFGSVKKSASGGSFGKSRRAAASVSSQFSTSMMRNKPFAAIIPETSAPSLDSKTNAIPEASVAPKLDSNKQNTVVAAIIPEATLAPPPSTDSKSTLGSLRVLIAEDNKINQKVLKRTLLRLGIKEIDIVDDGKKAVETSKDKIFDIVFMDMQMPVMDGLEATSVISQRAEHPKIVFLTAHALSEYQEKAIEAGGDLFISKPFKLGVIRGILESLVQDAIDLSDS